MCTGYNPNIKETRINLDNQQHGPQIAAEVISRIGEDRMGQLQHSIDTRAGRGQYLPAEVYVALLCGAPHKAPRL